MTRIRFAKQLQCLISKNNKTKIQRDYLGTVKIKVIFREAEYF